MARAVVARRLDFAPSLVWDALVDPDLVGGWLHPVAELVSGDGTRVEVLEEPSELVVETRLFGRTEFRLTPAPGLVRDRGTHLEVCGGPEVDPPFLPALAGVWTRRLDRLDELLRGRPADWGDGTEDPEAAPTA